VLKNQNNVVPRPAQSAVGKARLRESDSQGAAGHLAMVIVKAQPQRCGLSRDTTDSRMADTGREFEWSRQMA
jgi:hypothetical protein